MKQIHQWSDEILVEKYQRGDAEAGRVLVDRYYKICNFEARDSKQKLYDEDTRTGECMLALARAMDKYETGKGTTFNSYAKGIMRNALIDMARKEDRRPQEVCIHDETEGSELTMEDAFRATDKTDEDAGAEIARQALKTSIWEQLSAAAKGDGELDKGIIRAVRGLAGELAKAGRIQASVQATLRLFEPENANVLFLVSSGSEDGMMMPEEEGKWREELCDLLVDALINLVIMKSEGWTISESAEETGISELVISRLMLCVKILARDTSTPEPETNSEIMAGQIVILLPKVRAKSLFQSELFDDAEAA